MAERLPEDALEEIGQVADDLDSATFAAKLNLPAPIHIEGLTGSIVKARDRLKNLCRAHGFDPWDEEPDL